MENRNKVEEFEEVTIKCEYNCSQEEEEIESEPIENISEPDYEVTKEEEISYIFEFTDYFENFDTPNSADCLDTTIIDEPIPENESDCDSTSEPSTSSGNTSGFQTVREWNPSTRLGRMVKSGKNKSIEEIRESNLTILEPRIVTALLGAALRFEVICVKPLYDQSGDIRGYVSCTSAGDQNGHYGYSIKYDALRDVSIQGSIDRAIINVYPIKRASYRINNKEFHTVAFSVSGSSKRVTITLIPKFNTADVSIPIYCVKSMLNLAGIDNCYVEIKGQNLFLGHIALATYRALMKLSD